MLSFFKKKAEVEEEPPSGSQRSSGSSTKVSAAKNQNRLRVGYFSDLTTLPLTYGIENNVRSTSSVRKASVDELRGGLEEGEYEAALLPVWDFVKTINKLTLIPGTCVSLLGTANMFLLCSKVLPTEIQRVLVDYESFGGRSLAEIVLPNQMSIRPEFTRSPVPINPLTYDFQSDPHDAYLIAGEHALLVNRASFVWVYDLTKAWHNYNKQTYVMHVWCARRGVNLRKLPDELTALARMNEGRSDELAAKEADRLGLPMETMKLILKHALRVGLGPQELTGVRHYAKELAANRLISGTIAFSVYQPKKQTVA
ncbi:MAG: MqnA/MqnD/SBP family protein [Sumerlaeia bacterium]